MGNEGESRPIPSRRQFLLTFSGTCLAAPRIVPSSAKRYNDPATEFPILRLTDPTFTSVLPAHYQRCIARRGSNLLFASDLSGRMEAYRMELKTGIAHQLTEEEGLDPASLTFGADERTVCCVANGRLLLINVAGGRAREVYRVPEGFQPAGGTSVSEDGLYAASIERRDASHRLRLIRMSDGTATTIAEFPGEMRDPIPRPKRASVLYRRGQGLWLANYDGHQAYGFRLAEGEAASATWSPDGRSVLYLNYPVEPRRLHNIREFTPDTNEDKPVADTTQFVAFERNADASVFAGASGSKASPHVLLLVRAVRRELTLCEHRASDPTMVSPIFSPDSQHVYFVSDRHGKPAIYSIAVEKLVSATGQDQ
jgi:oligogalacturonide lyase